MLFPEPKFNITGLDPESNYTMSMRFDKVSDKLFTHNKIEFVETNDKSKQPLESKIYPHPRGIRNGEYWMKKPIEFKVRLTSDKKHTDQELILLESRCKYQAVLLISKFEESSTTDKIPEEFRLDCLQFVTVTKYYNSRVADVKSSLNYHSSRDAKRNRAIESEIETPDENETPEPVEERDSSGDLPSNAQLAVTSSMVTPPAPPRFLPPPGTPPNFQYPTGFNYIPMISPFHPTPIPFPQFSPMSGFLPSPMFYPPLILNPGQVFQPPYHPNQIP